MRSILASEFPHRSNKDGTIDSICPYCFITIGTATWEADLEQLEIIHVCNPERLRHFQRERKRLPSSNDQSDRSVA